MDNYSMYIGQQHRAQMNERRLDAARRRYSPGEQDRQPESIFAFYESSGQLSAAPFGQMPEAIQAGAAVGSGLGQEALMEKIMMQDFEAHELALYLNTHPGDTAALNMHRHSTARARELTEEYVRRFGPITSREAVSDTRWTWAEGPWPWQSR